MKLSKPKVNQKASKGYPKVYIYIYIRQQQDNKNLAIFQLSTEFRNFRKM